MTDPEAASDPHGGARSGARSDARIRSFVRRIGRMTGAQQRALNDHGDAYLIPADRTLEQEVSAALGPVLLEIGFGNGDALVEFARRHPEYRCIGLEVHRPGVGAAVKSAAGLALDNVRVAEADAVMMLEALPAAPGIDRVHLFFPDPWHKKRHHKRRILQPAFLDLLAHHVRPGGSLHFASDWAPYAEAALALLEAQPGWRNAVAGGGFAPRYSERPLTRFERRGERLGHAVFDLHFLRG